MKQILEKAASLLSVIKKLNNKDCIHFLQHLNDQGVELVCRILHYVLNGELRLSPRTKTRLRSKIKTRLPEFRRLATPPKRVSDIRKKRIILQEGGILGILTAIASSVVPIIAQLIASKSRR